MARALHHAPTALQVVTTTNWRRTTFQSRAHAALWVATATRLELTLNSAQALVPRDGTAGPVRPSA